MGTMLYRTVYDTDAHAGHALNCRSSLLFVCPANCACLAGALPEHSFILLMACAVCCLQILRLKAYRYNFKKL